MRPADFTGAVRRLRARPAYALLSVAVLGVGLGAVLFMLSLVDGLILRPLPFPAADRLVAIGYERKDDVGIGTMSKGDFRALQDDLQGVESLGLYAEADLAVSHRDTTQVHTGTIVSSRTLPILGVRPMLGRGFDAADDRSGAAPAVLLGERLWRTRFGADPDIVGRSVRIDRRSTRVTGIMPAGFAFPYESDLWLSAGAQADDALDGLVVARLAPGTSEAVARARLASLGAALGTRLEGQRAKRTLTLKPLAYAFVNEETRAYVWIMFAASMLVLLLACANVANLQLSQTLHRRRELAMRNALGATRLRLLSEQFAESLLLSLLATAVALLVTHAGSEWLLDIFAANRQPPPYFVSLGVDLRLLGYAMAAALAATALAGAIPALRASRADVQEALRDSDGGGAHGGAAFASGALVVGEIVLTIVLLVGAGSLILGLDRMLSMDLGTRVPTGDVLTARIDVLPNQFRDRAEQVRHFESLVARLREAPGAVSATAANTIPGAQLGSHEAIGAEGAARPKDGFSRAQTGSVDDHFAATYGLRLTAGRFFDARDAAGALPVAVVDRDLAESLWPDRDPIGRTLLVNPERRDVRRVRVVGVVDAMHLEGPLDPQLPSVVFPLRQWPSDHVVLAVHIRGDAARFAPRLVALVRDHGRDLPVHSVRTQRQAIDIKRISAVVLTQIFGAVGLVALVLAASGLYGVLAFSVVRRTREIGIRRAIGASDRAIVGLVGRRLGQQLSLGLVLGLAAAVPWSMLLADPGLQTRGLEPGVFILVVGVIVLVALGAATAPTLRALRLDPLVALRHD
ncbi:MAG: ADOP family duplicated permease [Stenotrophomonas sp.]